MKVTAIKPAFYNGRRVRVGDVITVADGLKGSWFTTAAFEPPKEAPPEPRALSELNNIARKTFTEVHEGKPLPTAKVKKAQAVKADEAPKAAGDFA